MKKLAAVLGLATVISLATVAPSLARNHHGWGGGGGAPAPEIGAGVLGMLLAGGAATYFRRRARD
jgi:hypothetical protein